MHTLMRLSSPPRLYLIKASIGLGIALTTLALPSTPACAGSWSGPDYTYSGTSTNSDGTSSPWTWGPDAYFYEPWFYGGVSYWGGQAASGDVQATFTWNPNPADLNDAPPTVWIRESADSFEGSNPDLSPSSADDGLGDTAVADVENNAWSHGTHYVKYSGQSAITLTHTLSAGGQGEVINMSYQAEACGQYIITSTIDDSRHYGAATTPDVFDAVTLNRRQSDGSITGDSAAAWSNIGHWVGNSTYTATNLGFTQPTWQWTPGGPVLAGTDSVDTQTKHIAFDFGSDTHTTLGQTTTTSCNVTDTDGFNDSNTYAVNWHYPYEKTADIDSVAMKEVKETLIGPVHAGDPAVNIPKAEGGVIDIAAGIDGVAASLAIGGQELPAGIAELIAAGAGLLDLKYNYGGEAEHPQGALNSQDKWDATRSRDWAENVSPSSLLSLRDPVTGQFAGWRFCDMSIKLVKRYHHKTWYADNYGGNGYVSSNNIMHADPIDKIDEEPFYTGVAPPPTNWSPS